MKTLLIAFMLFGALQSNAQTYFLGAHPDNSYGFLYDISNAEQGTPVIAMMDTMNLKLYADTVYFQSYKTRNNGAPTSILWVDAQGRLQRSPKDSLYIPVPEPVGVVKSYAGTSAPSGYLFCDGSAVSRTTYAALFGIIGTTYGAGNGTTTFNLPDLRQRFVMTKAATGTGAALGDTGGTIDHIHTVDPPNTTSGTPSATVANLGLLGVTSAATSGHTHDVNIAQFNSGTANPPYLVLNSIIKF
jgi:microcystin-dependent protein